MTKKYKLEITRVDNGFIVKNEKRTLVYTKPAEIVADMAGDFEKLAVGNSITLEYERAEEEEAKK